MRAPLLVAVVVAAAAAGGAGCGDASHGSPAALLGNYGVMITANGKTDTDVMTVNPASNDGVLLDFVYGISQVRCGLTGASQIAIPNQKLRVSHSTGVAEGIGSGKGTISAASVDITLDLVTAGLGPTDGGNTGGGTVTYKITGAKN